MGACYFLLAQTDRVGMAILGTLTTTGMAREQ